MFRKEVILYGEETKDREEEGHKEGREEDREEGREETQEEGVVVRPDAPRVSNLLPAHATAVGQGSEKR